MQTTHIEQAKSCKIESESRDSDVGNGGRILDDILDDFLDDWVSFRTPAESLAS